MIQYPRCDAEMRAASLSQCLSEVVITQPIFREDLMHRETDALSLDFPVEDITTCENRGVTWFVTKAGIVNGKQTAIGVALRSNFTHLSDKNFLNRSTLRLGPFFPDID